MRREALPDASVHAYVRVGALLGVRRRRSVTRASSKGSARCPASSPPISSSSSTTRRSRSRGLCCTTIFKLFFLPRFWLGLSDTRVRIFFSPPWREGRPPPVGLFEEHPRGPICTVNVVARSPPLTHTFCLAPRSIRSRSFSSFFWLPGGFMSLPSIDRASPFVTRPHLRASSS